MIPGGIFPLMMAGVGAEPLPPLQGYIAAGHHSSPYLTIYKQDGDTITKLPALDASNRPSNIALGCAFTPDGDYLIAAHVSSPYVSVYSRSGDVFTKLAAPADPPSGTATSVSIHGDHVIVGLQNAPYVAHYSMAAGVLTKLADPADLPSGSVWGVAFSPDGAYASTTHSDSPYVTTYGKVGNVLTKITDPAALPTGNGSRVAFLPDSSGLIATFITAPYAHVYSLAGSSMVKQVDPTPNPDDNGYGVAVSPDGTKATIGCLVSASGTILNTYDVNGFALTNKVDTDPGNASVPNHARYSEDGRYFASTIGSGDRLVVYKVGPGGFTLLPLVGGGLPSTGRGLAIWPVSHLGL